MVLGVTALARCGGKAKSTTAAASLPKHNMTTRQLSSRRSSSQPPGPGPQASSAPQPPRQELTAGSHTPCTAEAPVWTRCRLSASRGGRGAACRPPHNRPSPRAVWLPGRSRTAGSPRAAEDASGSGRPRPPADALCPAPWRGGGSRPLPECLARARGRRACALRGRLPAQRKMAAGASDPLEEMLLFSEEVDEKAVSDLVGSLESQLAGGRGSAEAPQPRTSAPSQQQQPQQQQHQGSLAGGSSPVRQQQGHPAPPPAPGVEEAAGCPGAAESRAPAQGPLPSPSPPAAAAAAAAAAGRGVSVNSSSVQQSHGPALLSSGGSSPAAPAPPQPAAPPPAGAPAQPVNNHVAAGAAVRDAGSPSPGGSPPAADSAPPQRAEAAAGNETPAGGTGPAGAAEGAAATTAPLPGEAAPNGEGAGGRPAAAPPVSSHGRADAATAQTKPAPGPLPAVNALSNSASPAPTAAAPPGQGSGANCAPAAPGAAPKPAVTAAGVAKAGAALPVAPAAPQALSPRPAMGAAPRIVAPQLIVRPPQQPAIQQTTIQLPPGFTIPPGKCQHDGHSLAAPSNLCFLAEGLFFFSKVVVLALLDVLETKAEPPVRAASGKPAAGNEDVIGAGRAVANAN